MVAKVPGVVARVLGVVNRMLLKVCYGTRGGC